MNILVNPQLEALIAAQLASGQFNTPEEVIAEGLRLLQAQQQELAEMRAEIQKGIDSGPSEEWDMDAFLKEARARADKAGIV